jgi:hypothetical protein
MSPRHLAFGLAATLTLAPLASQAANLVDQVSIHCSGNLVSSDTSGYSLQCTGDLDLSGQNDTARIWTDGALDLSATGNLILNHLTLDASSFTFTAGTSIQLASDVHLPTTLPGSPGLFVRTGEDPTLQVVGLTLVPADGSLSVRAGVVPEPAAWALAAVGLVGLALVRRRGA